MIFVDCFWLGSQGEFHPETNGGAGLKGALVLLGRDCRGRDASAPREERGKVLAMRKARRVMVVKKRIVFIILCCFLIL